MHLTNYSVNKHNESFDNDDSCDKGSKRTIKFFNTWLAARGYCVSELWTRITVSLYTHTYMVLGDVNNNQIQYIVKAYSRYE